MRRGLFLSLALGLLLAALWAVSVYALDRVTVTATFYHDRYQGRVMANGERYDAGRYSVACNFLPLGTPIRLTYGVHVFLTRVTDRMSETGQWRVDVSRAIAEEAGFIEAGHAEMMLEVTP